MFLKVEYLNALKTLFGEQRFFRQEVGKTPSYPFLTQGSRIDDKRKTPKTPK
jgi:hypothetical protein